MFSKKKIKLFDIYKHEKFHAQLSWAWKKFYNFFYSY